MIGLLSALFGAESIAAAHAKRKKSSLKNAGAQKANTNAAGKQKPQVASASAVNSAVNSIANNSVFAGARLGINIAGIADWGSEFPFADLFKQSREWVSQAQGAAWAAGEKLDIDEHGWVKRLAPNGFATTFLSSFEDGHYPSGDYLILYEGEGEIIVPFHTVKSSNSGRLVVNVDAKKGAFRLDIVKTNPQNYLKNIQVILLALEKAVETNPWNPDFLNRWSGASCLRFMDFMTTNGSAQVNWRDRPQLKEASYAIKGVPLELMIDLANRLNTEPWFCMPHQASDDYIKQFATIVKTHLKPNLRAWVEYSNEVWNGGFSQNAYASKEGQRLKFAEQPWQAAWKYTAHRSVQIFNIWQQVFAQDKNVKQKRFVRVLASQAANTGVAEQLLSFEQAAKQADVLAIAPYINFSVPPNADDGMTDKIVANWSLDKLFVQMNKVATTQTLQWIQNNKKIADQYGLKLVAYEAGQHLVGIAGAENNAQMASLFLKANADSRMGELYTQYLAHWVNNGGDLMCAFNSVGPWSKWGSWGLLQYNDEKPTPKFKAVIDWANARGQKMRL